MVDDVKDITEKAESKEALDRARLARERREAEQRKRLDELRAHAAAAQAQREKRDEDRRRRQAEQRAKDDDRRLQVEERKRAIWEASISRREALLQRERDRTERLERARAARSAPRPAFAFGSSTPRLLEPVDSAGFFWAARRAASTTNVMFASAPLTRRASALQLDTSDTDNKGGIMFSSLYEPDRSPQPVWSSVARRRTDLVPTLPARPETRSGETTPGSRPGSAMSNTAVVRRASSAPRKPRPASIAGADTGASSAATTPSVSRDASTVLIRSTTTPRRPRPLSLHAPAGKHAGPLGPGEGKPPLHRKPKPSKDHDKSGKSLSASPGRTLSPSPASKEPSVDKEVAKARHARDNTEENDISQSVSDKSQVSAIEVTQKLEALQIGDRQQSSEIKENVVNRPETNEQKVQQNKEEKQIDVQKQEKEKEEKKEEKREKEPSQEKTEENEMTASMTARRITTEEEAKAALAERRRRAREELERQAELERQRLQREAEEEAERQRQEEERQRREEEEARELAALQRKMEEEKLRKAIEAQQQLEKEEAERRAREEEEKKARAREDEERRRAADEAERLRREEAEREEKERLLRKQRVEAIMARTRLKKQAEEDKKQQEMKAQQNQQPASEPNNTSTPNTEQNTQNASVNNAKDAANTANAANNAPVNNAQETAATHTNAANVESAAPVSNSAENAPVSAANSSTETNAKDSSAKLIAVESSINSESAAPVNAADSSAPVTNSDNAAPANSSAPVAANNLPVTKSESEAVDSLIDISQTNSVSANDSAVSVGDNSNGNVQTGDLLQLAASQPESSSGPQQTQTQESASRGDNGNVTADLLGLVQQHETKDKPDEQPKQIDNTPTLDANNGNVGRISANFIQSERRDDFAAHNGHSHPLTLQNAI